MFTAPAFSDLVIDRYLAGEMADDERRAFDERIAAEPALKARVDELAASRRAFSVSAPHFAAIAAAAAQKPSWWARLTSPTLRFVLSGGALAAVAVVAVVQRGDDGNRSKGARFVDFVVERDGVVVVGAPGATVHPGDRVQFVVDAGAGSFVAVWSRDGAGTVSAYAPTDGAVERATGKHSFENSTRLDDVVGREVFVGVRCDHAVDTAVVSAAVSADEAPAGCAFDRVVVEKVAR